MTSQDNSFEKSLERLEKIVDELEEGELSLDSALKKYEEGVKLSRACQSKLAQAEQKIEVLTKTLSGEISSKPFDETDQALQPVKTAKRSRRSS